jgi:hypothetical protein
MPHSQRVSQSRAFQRLKGIQPVNLLSTEFQPLSRSVSQPLSSLLAAPFSASLYSQRLADSWAMAYPRQLSSGGSLLQQLASMAVPYSTSGVQLNVIQ